LTPAVADLRGSLLRWYRRHRRDLPWRRTRDPFAIWVSEVMLQQTRVSVVVPYYERFLRRFPDVFSLARAREEQVLAAWSGLGYYRRARDLREGARAVVTRHAGRIPDDPRALRALPGVGPYTAGAIASLAFGRPEPVLDGNVRRVLSRLYAIPAGPDLPLWDLAGSFARCSTPADANQALMELGALVCTPRAPDCGVCPVSTTCRARALGTPEAFPPPGERRAVERVRVAVALVERRGRVLVERPGETRSPLRGSWDLPAVEIAEGAAAGRRVEQELRRRHGLTVHAEDSRGGPSHSILNRRLELEIVTCRVIGAAATRTRNVRWVARERYEEMPLSGASRKVLRLAGA
jgi:A/G-specific adenine glycosylase